MTIARIADEVKQLSGSEHGGTLRNLQFFPKEDTLLFTPHAKSGFCHDDSGIENHY